MATETARLGEGLSDGGFSNVAMIVPARRLATTCGPSIPFCETMIEFANPVAPDRDLGKEYNRVIRQTGLPWVCLTDCDALFLTRMDQVRATMVEAITHYPENGLFTCVTNRIYNRAQQLGGFSENSDILPHLKIALEQIAKPLDVVASARPISGFMMLVSKRLWEKVGGFPEGGRFLQVDTKFSNRCRRAGSPPLVIRNIYMFHLYRFGTSRNDVSHLV